MMTAGERLRQLAGTTGTAAALLLIIGSGATAGDALAKYSGLESAPAAEHLLADAVGNLKPGGHLKHLFIASRQAETPLVKARAAPSWVVLQPETVVKLRIAAEPPILERCALRLQGSVLDPAVGLCTPVLTGPIVFRATVSAPRCGGVAPLAVRGCWGVAEPQTPFGGAVSPAVEHVAETGSVVLRPVCIQNPPLSLLVLL